MSSYELLNPKQKEAVFCTEGPLLILAGAGSGKTRVLTYRIAHLIEDEGVNPWNIMAITFTNKAAGEMRERVDQQVQFGSESIWVSTFHSSCVLCSNSTAMRDVSLLVGVETQTSFLFQNVARRFPASNRGSPSLPAVAGYRSISSASRMRIGRDARDDGEFAPTIVT